MYCENIFPLLDKMDTAGHHDHRHHDHDHDHHHHQGGHFGVGPHKFRRGSDAEAGQVHFTKKQKIQRKVNTYFYKKCVFNRSLHLGEH